jgi:hypothetical protein
MLDWIVQHLIANIPVAFWIFVAGGGLGSYIVLGFISHLPTVGSYAKVIRALSLIVVGFGLFMCGGSGVSKLWQEQLAAKQAEIDNAVKQSATANVKIRYVIKQKLKVIHEKQIVVHTMIKQDASQIDATCKVSKQAVNDLNEAAK